MNLTSHIKHELNDAKTKLYNMKKNKVKQGQIEQN